jgi:hypothetical protein
VALRSRPMDARARDIFAAGWEILPMLPELLGDAAPAVDRELRTELARAAEEWRAELVREILFENPPTRAYLEERVPAAKAPAPFPGRDIRRGD